MIHLVNQESIIVETLFLARLALAKELSVEPERIDVVVTTDGNKLKPQFNIATEVTDKFEEEIVRDKIARAWLGASRQLNSRLQGLFEKRNG